MSFQFVPIELFACVYVLELEDHCIYVGATMNFNVSMAQHFSGTGSKWTKLHKPLKVLEVIYPLTPGLENKITQKYFDLKGRENVRGGSWCKVECKEKTNPYTIQFDISSTDYQVNHKKNAGFLSGIVDSDSELENDEN
jgi:hypothetical protein